MKFYITFIVTLISSGGFCWFGYQAYRIGQQSGMGYLGEFIFNGGIAVMLAIVAIVFGLLTYKM